jgi:hypothetical protein
MLGATEWRLKSGCYEAQALGCLFRVNAQAVDGHHYGTVTDLRNSSNVWSIKVKAQRLMKHTLMDAHEQFRIHRARATGVG